IDLRDRDDCRLEVARRVGEHQRDLASALRTAARCDRQQTKKRQPLHMILLTKRLRGAYTATLVPSPVSPEIRAPLCTERDSCEPSGAGRGWDGVLPT